MKPRANYLAGVLSVVWLLFIAVPIYAILSASLRDRRSYLDGGPVSIPSDGLVLDNFIKVLTGPFPKFFITTAIITIAVVAITVALALPIGYAVVRGIGSLTRATFLMFLLGLAIPAQAVIIPMFWIMNELGLYDTIWAVILPTAAFSMPVAVLILTAGMRDVPGELYEAAGLDGASTVRTFFTIVIPLSKASIATIAVFTGMNAWNGFLFPLVLTQSEETKVLTLGLYEFINQYGADIPALFAAVLLSAVPIFAVYLFGRRFLVQGLTGIGK
jgi:xylobiose transport system permease protein